MFVQIELEYPISLSNGESLGVKKEKFWVHAKQLPCLSSSSDYTCTDSLVLRRKPQWRPGPAGIVIAFAVMGDGFGKLRTSQPLLDGTSQYVGEVCPCKEERLIDFMYSMEYELEQAKKIPKGKKVMKKVPRKDGVGDDRGEEWTFVDIDCPKCGEKGYYLYDDEEQTKDN